MNASKASELTVTNWRPRESGSLRGFFSLVLPSGLIIHDCALFEKNNRRWVNLPSRQYESQGEKKFAPLVAFLDRDTEDDFQFHALAAIDKSEATRGRS